MKRMEEFDLGFSAKKSTIACPFVAFWGMKCISYCDSNMAHLVSQPLKAEGFVIRSRRGLTLDTTWIVCLIKYAASSGRRTLRLGISFQLGCSDVPLQP